MINSEIEIGIIGFGRFGKLLVKHLSPDFKISVFDIKCNIDKADIATHIKTMGGIQADLQEICKKDIVIPAVPISEFEDVIKQIAPLLKKGNLVMDVCSVKEFPAKIMKENLPEETQIIAAHPMFGPDSATESLEGRKIVMCKVRITDKLFKNIKNHLESKGLIVIETTPEEHDKQIAISLGLTHFIGRSLIDFKADTLTIDTEGYNRLMHILGVVKNDTWQLFEDMNHYNRFSEEIRQRFMESIKKIDKKVSNKKDRRLRK